MKRFSLFCVVFLVVFPSSIFSQTVVNIASWNLGGFEPIPQVRVTNQVRAIRRLNPTVMVLSEVNPNQVAANIANQLGNYRAVILPQTAQQNLAILYRNHPLVRVNNVRLIDGSDDGNSRLRKAIAANVKIGNFDFILIGVHMKSERPQPQEGESDPQRVRTRQARAISQFISNATQSGEKDVLVIGDYNMIPGEDRVNFLEMSPGSGQNEMLFYISDVLSNRPSHISRCDGNQVRGNFLDGFSVSRNFTREYIPASINMITNENTNVFGGANGTPYTCTTYKGLVSDHFPLIARFWINMQDDD